MSCKPLASLCREISTLKGRTQSRRGCLHGHEWCLRHVCMGTGDRRCPERGERDKRILWLAKLLTTYSARSCSYRTATPSMLPSWVWIEICPGCVAPSVSPWLSTTIGLFTSAWMSKVSTKVALRPLWPIQSCTSPKWGDGTLCWDVL